MANAERFSIKRYTTNSGEERWKIDGRRIDGSRVRERFKTRDKAVVRKNELEVDASNQSDCVRLRKTRLTDDQLLEAEAAFLKLNGKPLFAAVDFYLDHFREPIIPIELGDAFRLFMADKHHENLRPRYLSPSIHKFGDELMASGLSAE